MLRPEPTRLAIREDDLAVIVAERQRLQEASAQEARRVTSVPNNVINVVSPASPALAAMQLSHEVSPGQ